MKVLCILTVYNEIKYLPIKIRYCEANGLTPYFIDNYSTDGTWEWLKKHGIDSHRFDTGGSFDLPALQAEIVRTIHTIKPDWVVYNGCDLFPVVNIPLNKYIEVIDYYGYNVADMFCISMCNTGEKMQGFDPFNTYFYYEEFRNLRMIHKYHQEVVYSADNVSIPNMKPFIFYSGVMINYGQTKAAEERNETLKRRQKAWQNGMNQGHGSHYLEGEKRGWIWDKSELIDVRTSPFYSHVKHLQTLVK